MTQQPTRDTGFSDVDKGADPKFFVRSLDVQTSQPFYQTYKQRTFELLNLRKGDHILDVGCGVGDDARTMAHIVGPDGFVTGVDSSETMIREARERTIDLNLPVEFVLSDAQQLNLPDSVFDACRADRTFEHLEAPRQALRELIRVTKPGGRIVVVDPDLDTMVIDALEHEVVRRFLNFRGDTLRCGWVAHHMPAAFKEFGLHDVSVIAMTNTFTDYALANDIFRLEGGGGVAQECGVLSEHEAQRLIDYWRRAGANATFFLGLTYFITSGQKKHWAEPAMLKEQEH